MPHSIKIALVSSEVEDLTDMLEVGGSDAGKKWLLAALVGLVGLLRRLRRSKPARGDKPVDSEGGEEGEDGQEEGEEEEEGEEDDSIDDQAEMKRVQEWVKSLIVMEGEKGKGCRWIDLGRAHFCPADLPIATNANDKQRSSLRMKAGEVKGNI